MGRSAGTSARWFAKVLAPVVTAVVAIGLTATASQAQTTDDVGTMASHKSPFNCGKTF